MAESDFPRPFILGYGSSPSRCGPAAIAERSIARSPGSRARSVCTCQVLRPRRVVRTLRWRVRNVLPSALETASAPGSKLSRLNGPAYALPYRRFVVVLANGNARLGADVDRYSFIVVDLHHLLLAGLPAQFESDMPSHAVGLCRLLAVVTWQPRSPAAEGQLYRGLPATASSSCKPGVLFLWP